MNDLALLVAATLAAGTPLALAGIGLLINERAGVLNLGAEGLMLVAAVPGFAAGLSTGSEVAALTAGALAGGLGLLPMLQMMILPPIIFKVASALEH